ncbi:hypothetical protein [Streptomyces sp. NPDC058486]|uniref:hypothetical protein n=1 Tax=unclassified Streptomyces TaxID=2593676 RepID=UPI0036579628
MDELERDPLTRALFPEDGDGDGDGHGRDGHGDGRDVAGDGRDGAVGGHDGAGDGAADDPEVARALADVALLREQLGVLAAALTAEPVPENHAVRLRSRRRGRTAAWALAACVALGALGTGGAWLAARPPAVLAGGGAAADAKLTGAGLVACATDVAEGTVVRAEPLAEGEFRVVLRVERRYKPAGPDSGELAFRGWAAEPSYYRPGTRMLVVVSRFPGEGVLTYRQDREPPGELGEDVGPVRDELEYGRKWIGKALPEAATATCPGRG